MLFIEFHRRQGLSKFSEITSAKYFDIGFCHQSNTHVAFMFVTRTIWICERSAPCSIVAKVFSPHSFRTHPWSRCIFGQSLCMFFLMYLIRAIFDMLFILMYLFKAPPLKRYDIYYHGSLYSYFVVLV